MNAGPGSQAVFVVMSSSNTNGSSNYGLCCRSRQGFLVVKCMKIIKRRCNSQKSPIKINSDVLVILQKCNCQFGSLFTLHIYKLLTLKVKHLPRLPFFWDHAANHCKNMDDDGSPQDLYLKITLS